jgi:hypothetical protein
VSTQFESIPVQGLRCLGREIVRECKVVKDIELTVGDETFDEVGKRIETTRKPLS